MKNNARTLVGLCAAVIALVVAPPAACADGNAAGIDAQISALTFHAKFLELQSKMFKGVTYPKSVRKACKRAVGQLAAINAQISQLQEQKAANSAKASGGEVPGIVDEIDEITDGAMPLLPGENGFGEKGINPPKSDLIDPFQFSDEDDEYDDGDDDEEEEDGVDDNDHGNGDANAPVDADDDDPGDDDDEPETEPHRRWLEEYIDKRLEGVPDWEWQKRLCEAYFEAYDILKADSTCPPEVLAEVADLCDRYRTVYETISNAPDESDVPDGDADPESDDTGSPADEPSDGESPEDPDVGERSGEEVEGEAEEEEEEGEPGWAGEYIDDDLSVFDERMAADGSGGSDGSDGNEFVSGTDESSDTVRFNPASGGGAPATMGALYGRGGSTGPSVGGASFAGAGSYFGNGASGDGSVATNFADDISCDLLRWRYGGFKAPTNALRSTVTISELRFSRNGLRIKWIRDLGAWGIPYEEPDALACLFVKNEAGEWVGGKFEWISSSRETRDLGNVYGGYNGWSLRDVPNPCEAAFVVFRKDGKRRSNIVVGLWER